MITTIIFDWGGVVIKDPSQGILTYCAQYLHLPVETLCPILQQYESGLQKGIISEQKFWNNICRDLNIPIPATKSLWQDAFQHAYQEQPEMITLIKYLKKKGYTVVLLSNTEPSSVHVFQDHNYNLFDLCIFSCTEGVIKPDPRIYHIALQKLQTLPSHTLFIDDKPENIHTATHLGMKTILFTTPKQLKQSLQSFSIYRS